MPRLLKRDTVGFLATTNPPPNYVKDQTYRKLSKPWRCVIRSRHEQQKTHSRKLNGRPWKRWLVDFCASNFSDSPPAIFSLGAAEFGKIANPYGILPGYPWNYQWGWSKAIWLGNLEMVGQPLGGVADQLILSQEMRALDFAKMGAARANHGWNMVIKSLWGLPKRWSGSYSGWTCEYMDKLLGKFHIDKWHIKVCKRWRPQSQKEVLVKSHFERYWGAGALNGGKFPHRYGQVRRFYKKIGHNQRTTGTWRLR